jgi:hypothetical protein
MRILMEPTKDAATTEFEVGKTPVMQPCIPVTLLLIGGTIDVYGGTNEITIKFADDSGATRNWRQLVSGASRVVLDSDNNFVVIDFPGLFRLDKGRTTANIGVAIA